MQQSSSVCGLDEVGRGAWAGPLVAAGVVLGESKGVIKLIRRLRDSKQLNKLQRNRIYKEVVKCAYAIEVEIISALQINNQGIGWANKEIFRRLIKRTEADKYIVDGNLKVRVNGKSNRIESMIKADQKVPEVMAASIVAKVTRDRLMKELADKFLSYGWESNAGYGTSYHLRAVETYGPTRYHRDIFVTTALRKREVNRKGILMAK